MRWAVTGWGGVWSSQSGVAVAAYDGACGAMGSSTFSGRGPVGIASSSRLPRRWRMRGGAPLDVAVSRRLRWMPTSVSSTRDGLASHVATKAFSCVPSS